MSTTDACSPPDPSGTSSLSLRSSRPCAASWSRSEARGVLEGLRAAQNLASRLERTERERPSHPAALRVQVVTDEALHEWVRFYTAVVGLLEAETVD